MDFFRVASEQRKKTTLYDFISHWKEKKWLAIFQTRDNII